jgi:opacity protein-like surface antigen
MKTASVVFVVFLASIPAARAQATDSTTFDSKNTFSPFVEYSNDSSHIVLGRSENRKFVALGLQYEHRLLSNHTLDLRYAAEFRPLILESDPTGIITEIQTSPAPTMIFAGTPQAVSLCVPAQRSFSFVDPTTGVLFAGTVQTTCSRRWTYAQGLSPFGTRINLFPHRRLQPTGSLLAGYMLSAKRIPIDTAGSFNFTFEIGAGLEYFFSHSRSMRFEYQVQHFSNANTADTNPGVDSGLFKLSYTFGR